MFCFLALFGTVLPPKVFDDLFVSCCAKRYSSLVNTGKVNEIKGDTENSAMSFRRVSLKRLVPELQFHSLSPSVISSSCS